ncbi:MAG: endonuclease/exonuclease/phosphatase family protein, partial [Planctomycetota bacterium]
PTKPGSKSWDSSLHRICTWGRFERIGAGEPQTVWVMNTHFDHRGSTARLKSARMIRQKIEQRPKEMIHEPIIVLGDLNTSPGSSPIIALGMADALRESSSGTWNGWDSNNRTGPRIDFILSRELDAITGKVDFLTTKDGRPASDHWPIRAILRTPRRPY